jgi:hypothetical protein
VAVTARWVADQRGEDHDAFGARLVANYDRLLPSGRRAAVIA